MGHDMRDQASMERTSPAASFEIPGPDTDNPLDCLDGEAIAECFSGVNDLGALDVARASDHGMPGYNELRVAYGLAPVTSFAELIGEATDDLGPRPL